MSKLMAIRATRTVAAIAVMVAALLPAAECRAQTNVHFKFLAKFTQSVGTGASLQAIALGKVNLDDDFLDLVAVDNDNNAVSVLLGNGDGTFRQAITYTLDFSPTSVAIADVASPFASDKAGDIDGKPDLIIGGDTGELSILLGNGDGTFSPAEQDFSTILNTGGILGIVVGNFDADNQHLDIAVLDDSDAMFFLCNSAGNFNPCMTDTLGTKGTNGISVASGDFDGNGTLDIAVLNQDATPPSANPDISVFYGGGDGSFTLASRSLQLAGDLQDSTPVALAAGRVNNDSNDDLIAVYSNTGFGDQFGFEALGNSNRSFTTHTFTLQFNATSVTLNDFNGDGFLDVVAGNQDGSNLTVSLGSTDGQGTFPQSPLAFPADGALTVVSGDLGGPDSLPELVLVTHDGGSIQVGINDSRSAPTSTPVPGQTTTPVQTPTGSGPTSTRTPIPPTNTPTLTATPTSVPTANYSSCDLQAAGAGRLAGVATGLLDADGTTDVAVTDATNNNVYVLFNTAALQSAMRACAMATSPTPLAVTPAVIAVGPTPGPIAVVDVKRDGHRDLVVAESDGIRVLSNDGQGHFTAGTPIAVGRQPAAIVADYTDPNDPTRRIALDLNNDGHTDLVVANAGDNFLSILYGDGNGGFTVVNQNIAGSAKIVVAADFNLDGKVDLAAGPVLNNQTILLTQVQVDSSGHAVFHSLTFGAGDPIVALSTGFFDGDRLADLLVTRSRGRSSGSSEIYLTHVDASSNVTMPTTNASFGTGAVPTASGVGFFNSADANSDAVVSSHENANLKFALGNGTGGLLPDVAFFPLGAKPLALAVGNIDADNMQDVVTANENGTISVLLSSVPPPTPTPLPTGTPTVTATLTATMNTSTPTYTPTASPIPSATGTMTGTIVASATPKKGAFGLSGGCSVDGSPGRPPLEAGALLALLALGSWRRRRALLRTFTPEARSRGEASDT